MAKHKQKKEKKSQTERELDALEKIEDSAHKIWLAGLGAFSKAEQEGGKLFKSLIKEGTNVEEQYREHLVGSVKKAASTTASTIDFMEEMFAKRMSEVIDRVQRPAAESMDAIVKQMGDLRSSILGVMGIPTETPAEKPAAPRKKTAKKKAAKKKVVKKKAATKKTTKKKTASKRPTARKTTKKTGQ